jgi:DNA-binding response OmpR family regulator
MKVVGVIHELMFSTRLADTARDCGWDCQVVREAAGAPDQFEGADLVVIDLAVRGGGALDAVTAAHAAGVPVIAYGRHTEVEVLQSARDAGADEVLTRSEFAYRLPVLLGGDPRR